MNKERRFGVAEVERSQIEQVGDQHDLSGPEVASHPEHDKSKLEEVVLHRY